MEAFSKHILEILYYRCFPYLFFCCIHPSTHLHPPKKKKITELSYYKVYNREIILLSLEKKKTLEKSCCENHNCVLNLDNYLYHHNGINDVNICIKESKLLCQSFKEMDPQKYRKEIGKNIIWWSLSLKVKVR